MSNLIKESIELANSLDYYDSSGGSAPAEAADIIRALVDRLKAADEVVEAAKDLLFNATAQRNGYYVSDGEINNIANAVAEYNGEAK